MVSIMTKSIGIWCLLVSSLATAEYSAEDLFKEASNIEVPFREKAAQTDIATPNATAENENRLSGHVEYFYSGDARSAKGKEGASEANSIVFSGPGEFSKLNVSVYGEVKIFIRDPSIVIWNEDEKMLESKAAGRTEAFVVNGNQLMIVPVEVTHENQYRELNVSEHLADLSSDLSNTTVSNLGSMSLPYEPVPTKEEDETSDEVNESEFFTVSKESASPQYKNIAIQVVDERSKAEENLIYPIEGATVTLVGSGFSALTNAKGIVEIPQVPSSSRAMVQVKDEQGRVLSQVVEIATNAGNNSELFRIKSLSYRSYYLYSNSFDVAQQTNLSSMCIRAMDKSGENLLSGVRAELNVEAEGPFYFSKFGPDPSLDESTENGRFCFFNVPSGLVELSFYEGESYLSSVTLPLLVGRHLEDDIQLANGPKVTSHVVALPSASQTVYGDYDPRNQYFDVDFTELLAVGENEEYVYKGPGVLSVEQGQTFYRGRLYSLSQGAEFETSLYSYDSIAGGGKVLPMLQRGFTEDLFNELYLAGGVPDVAFDSNLGSVYVLHGGFDGEDLDKVKIRLVDQFGRNLDEPWYIGTNEDGFSKAVFFNLKPGMYTVIVESASNHWVDSTTVAVDYTMTSFVQTGAQLKTN